MSDNTAICPSCRQQLRIPDSLLGQQLKCPACGQTFPAPTGDGDSEHLASPTRPFPERDQDAPPARRPEPERAERSHPDEEDRPRRRRDEDDDRRVRRREDDEEDERPRRRRSQYVEHRGTMILVFGICAWVVAPIPFGPIAWFLGNQDMREIRAGRMDPEGESPTQIGRILGMVSTILTLLIILGVCLVFGIIFLAAAGAGAGAAGGR